MSDMEKITELRLSLDKAETELEKARNEYRERPTDEAIDALISAREEVDYVNALLWDAWGDDEEAW